MLSRLSNLSLIKCSSTQNFVSSLCRRWQIGIRAFAHYIQNSKICSYLPYTLQLFFTIATIFPTLFSWAVIFSLTFLEISWQFLLQCVRALQLILRRMGQLPVCWKTLTMQNEARFFFCIRPTSNELFKISFDLIWVTWASAINVCTIEEQCKIGRMVWYVRVYCTCTEFFSCLVGQNHVPEILDNWALDINGF